MPADTDPADLTYIATAVQGLANRTRFLVDKVGGTAGTGEWLYGDTPREKKIMVELASGRPIGAGAAKWEQGASNSWQSAADVGVLTFGLNPYLLDGDVITDVEIWYGTGGARSAGNGMKFGLYRKAPDLDIPANNPVSSFLLLSALGEDHTSTKDSISLASLMAYSGEVFRDICGYEVTVTSGVDGSTVIDHVYAVVVTVNRKGPG
jgi:hypothetical protein